MRNDYIIVVDKGEAFIWIHCAVIWIHSRLLKSFLYIYGDLSHSVGIERCSICECFKCASSEFANLCITKFAAKTVAICL